jgi:putative ABC transport system ATP-binding protein
MQVLARLCREQGRTIIVVTHDPSLTQFTSRRIHLLDGRMANGE